jgi:flagellar biosynthesis/type III secretory pathway chaperone
MANQTTEIIAKLEKLLVNQFRKLQELINITRQERETLPSNDANAIMQLVETKETILDQLSLMEDSRKMYIHELSSVLDVQIKNFSLNELLPHLGADDAARLSRLNDGIASLVSQARDLNYGNKVLAVSMVDWLHSAQAFLLNFAQTQIDYRPAAAVPNLEYAQIHGLDHKV